MTPAPTEETVLWKGSPSQWTNFGTYLFCLFLAVGIVAVYFLVPNAPTLIFASLAVPVLFALLQQKCRG